MEQSGAGSSVPSEMRSCSRAMSPESNSSISGFTPASRTIRAMRRCYRHLPSGIEARLSNLESLAVILRDDIECRRKDVEENRKIAEEAVGLETFAKRLLFSREYLAFM
jgi:hypothetical protein